MMKLQLQVVGIEVSEGTSKKSGNAYSMGTLHTIEKLAPPFGGKDNIAKGYMGSKFDCDVGLVRQIAHLPFPLECELTLENVMKFGKREQVVTDVVPLGLTAKGTDVPAAAKKAA